MIDLNNTWCEATEENYNKLVEFGCEAHSKFPNFRFNPTRLTVNGNWITQHQNLTEKDYLKYRQIHLVNGEFEYVTNTEKIALDIEKMNNPIACNYVDGASKLEEEQNSFNKFGFETPSFDGEILKEVSIGYIGVIDNFVPTKWDTSGRCLGYGLSCPEQYNLTPLKPIKHKWYENDSNFPCIVKNLEIGEYFIAYKNDKDFYNSKYRPATNEEIEALKIKE